jgi:hypothetical protein
MALFGQIRSWSQLYHLQRFATNRVQATSLRGAREHRYSRCWLNQRSSHGRTGRTGSHDNMLVTLTRLRTRPNIGTSSMGSISVVGQRFCHYHIVEQIGREAADVSPEVAEKTLDNADAIVDMTLSGDPRTKAAESRKARDYALPLRDGKPHQTPQKTRVCATGGLKPNTVREPGSSRCWSGWRWAFSPSPGRWWRLWVGWS